MLWLANDKKPKHSKSDYWLSQLPPTVSDSPHVQYPPEFQHDGPSVSLPGPDQLRQLLRQPLNVHALTTLSSVRELQNRHSRSSQSWHDMILDLFRTPTSSIGLGFDSHCTDDYCVLLHPRTYIVTKNR